MPVSDLGDFLRRPDVISNEVQLCELYNSYNQTPAFLEAVCTKHRKAWIHRDIVMV